MEPITDCWRPEAVAAPRVLVGVCSCRRNFVKRAVVRETWLHRVPSRVRVVFFLGEGDAECEPDVWQLPCPDAYEALPIKIQSFVRKALCNPSWEYLFKCDDDTYVVLDRLLRLLGTGEYIGNEESFPLGFASGGAGYLITRRCAKILAEAPNPEPGAEDLWVSRTLQSAGVKLQATSALQAYCRNLPAPDNELVTAHWCSEELMRVIQTGFREPSVTEVAHSFNATHPAWSGGFKLLKCGFFLGGGSGPDGHWELIDNGATLRLKWLHWGEDRLERTEFGYANASLRLERVSSEGMNNNGNGTMEGTPQANGETHCSVQESEKLHVGAGCNHICGWRNHDLDMDLREPLPLADNSIRFIFAEHVIEHLTPQEAWRFLKEARRVLKPNGAIRIAVPCVDLIAQRYDPEYASFLSGLIGGDGSKEAAVESIICNWGHRSIWTVAALRAVLETLGFRTMETQPGVSHFSEMAGIDGHAGAIGEHANWVESGLVEAVKPLQQ